MWLDPHADQGETGASIDRSGRSASGQPPRILLPRQRPKNPLSAPSLPPRQREVFRRDMRDYPSLRRLACRHDDAAAVAGAGEGFVGLELRRGDADATRDVEVAG